MCRSHLLTYVTQALAKSPITKKFDLSSITEIASGAAPLGGEVIEEFEALWPAGGPRMTARLPPNSRMPMLTGMQQGWGMTEATCSLMGWDPTVIPVAGSVGELNANCKAKIMDPDGKTEVPAGQRGEIWVQGPRLVIIPYFYLLPIVFEDTHRKQQHHERLLA
jgi:4-coumarate--CoA ligase